MRRKALERAQERWEEQASDRLPSSFPADPAYVVRSPMTPTLMPSIVRFVAVADDRGARPVSRRLESALEKWLSRVRAADVPESHGPLAMAMAREVGRQERLVVALFGGAGDYRFTHYRGWQPDFSWRTAGEWEARFNLVAADGDFTRVLADFADWFTVPEEYAGNRSVLVACPQRDVVDGAWWKYATGSRGAPMPVLEIGQSTFAEEVFWSTGACDTRAPTLRELHGSKAHFFAIADGPAGHVSFADAKGVGWGSGFLDRLDAAALAHQHELLTAEEWVDVDNVFDRLKALMPRMREFYDRAYRADYWIAHFGFVDELEPLATEYVVEAGAGSTVDPAL